MTANTSPIYGLTPKTPFAKITAADTGSDGTGANVASIYTVGTNGAFLLKMVFSPRSTSGSTTTSSAVARIYINNGSSIGTGSNNALIREIPLPTVSVTTAAVYTAVALGIEVAFDVQLPASYVIACGITIMSANTCWDVSCWASDY